MMSTAGMDMMEREYQDRLAALREEVERVTAERDKLKQFKEYVHARLDAAGVPTDPESPHRAEGCRIGGRLDIVLTDRVCADPKPKPKPEVIHGWCPACNSRCFVLHGTCRGCGHKVDTLNAEPRGEAQ